MFYGKPEKINDVINTIILRVLKIKGILHIDSLKTFKSASGLYTMRLKCQTDKENCPFSQDNIILRLSEDNMSLNWIENVRILHSDTYIKNEFINECEKTAYFLLDSLEDRYKLKEERILCKIRNIENDFNSFEFKLSASIDCDSAALIKKIDDNIICYYLRQKSFLETGVEITDKEMPFFVLIFKETQCHINYTDGSLKTTNDFQEFFNFKTDQEKRECIELIQLNYQF